ncbi:MAG: PEP-CTERM sorting domain-containing protein [Planctomycetota bacterium]
MNRLRIVLAAAAIAATLTVSAAHATFVQPSSWTRGAFGTTYQEWDVFTDASGGPNAPDVADVNPNGSASLAETSPNFPGPSPFITSGGNIYSFATQTAFTVTIPEADVPAPPHDVTAIVQVATLGTEPDLSSFLLNGLAAVDQAELSRGTAAGGFGGSEVENWFLFNVPYSAFGDGVSPTDLTLTFEASGSSMSLDRIAIDTAIRPFGFFAEPNPIPEPSALALLMTTATCGLVGSVRRRRSA